MTTIHLTTNGPAFNLPHSALLGVASYVARHAAFHQDLFRALLDLNIPPVTEALTDHVDVDDISIEDADRMWRQGTCDTRHSLLLDNTFLQRLSKEQMEDLLRMDDSRLLITVAKYFAFDTQKGHRLDKDAVAQLHAFIESRLGRKIRKAPMANDYLELALDALREGDYTCPEVVQLFRMADREFLNWLACNMSEIISCKMRSAMTKRLMEYPDPLYRQILAMEPQTPKDVLELLANGDDPIAAGYAVKRLKDMDA